MSFGRKTLIAKEIFEAELSVEWVTSGRKEASPRERRAFLNFDEMLHLSAERKKQEL